MRSHSLDHVKPFCRTHLILDYNSHFTTFVEHFLHISQTLGRLCSTQNWSHMTVEHNFLSKIRLILVDFCSSEWQITILSHYLNFSFDSCILINNCTVTFGVICIMKYQYNSYSSYLSRSFFHCFLIIAMAFKQAITVVQAMHQTYILS